MNFTYKMVLGTTLIISILFSFGGILLIQQNFKVSFDNTISTNKDEHIVERYSMEQRVRSVLEKGRTCSNDDLTEAAKKLAGYGSKSNYLLIYLEDNTCCYSNLPDFMDRKTVDSHVRRAASEYELIDENEMRYMIVSSKITVGTMKFTIVNVYDLKNVYGERDRQLQSFIRLDIFIVVIAIIAVFILSLCLTRPIKKLNIVSMEIANGAYEQRTHIKSKDEIGELATSFNAMADAIEEKIKELEVEISNRESFISNFSHEMKTPMTSIMGYARLLTNLKCKDVDRLMYAERINRECKRLESLSRKMLKLMEIDEEPEEFSTLETLWIGEELKVICNPIMGQVNLHVEIEPSRVKADSILLLDLLKNLVDNARKACKENGMVHVYGLRLDKGYLFKVVDNGCGIPKEELSRIMEPFYMVDKSRARKQGGSGLGLALCKKICLYHHSELKVESKMGIGTTMSFVIEVSSDEEFDQKDN